MEHYPYNEKELLEQLIAGNEAAFKSVYDHYSGRLLANLLKLVKDPLLAREILQDLFVKVWDKRQLIDPEKPFRSWLYKIAENIVYDRFRKISRDKRLQQAMMQSATDFYLHVEEGLLNKENAAFLRQAIDAMPPQRRRIFILCRVEGKTYEEVSRLLGISTSTISDHIVKANRFLQQELRRNLSLTAGLISLLWLGGS